MATHRLPRTAEVRNIIEDIKNEKYKNAFKYLYLIAGRPCEVNGAYGPKGKDAYRITLKGEPAVLFAVNTAKIKKFRAVAVPLNPEYEPWAEDVLKWFEEHKNENPFIFTKKADPDPRTNPKYISNRAKKIFADLEWPIPKYSRMKESEDAMELDMLLTLKNKGKLNLLYQPPLTEAFEEEHHWRRFMAMSLRLCRAFELIDFHDFQGIDLALYGGWNVATTDTSAPTVLNRYLHPAELDLTRLRTLANRYFEKLLKTPIKEKYLG